MGVAPESRRYESLACITSKLLPPMPSQLQATPLSRYIHRARPFTGSAAFISPHPCPSFHVGSVFRRRVQHAVQRAPTLHDPWNDRLLHRSHSRYGLIAVPTPRHDSHPPHVVAFAVNQMTFLSKSTRKTVHVTFHCLALLCVAVGLSGAFPFPPFRTTRMLIEICTLADVALTAKSPPSPSHAYRRLPASSPPPGPYAHPPAVVKFHNDKAIPHLYSSHSWLGILTLLAYGCQVRSQAAKSSAKPLCSSW